MRHPKLLSDFPDGEHHFRHDIKSVYLFSFIFVLVWKIHSVGRCYSSESRDMSSCYIACTANLYRNYSFYRGKGNRSYSATKPTLYWNIHLLFVSLKIFFINTALGTQFLLTCPSFLIFESLGFLQFYVKNLSFVYLGLWGWDFSWFRQPNKIETEFCLLW